VNLVSGNVDEIPRSGIHSNPSPGASSHTETATTSPTMSSITILTKCSETKVENWVGAPEG
jgi:hypothetical protein